MRLGERGEDVVWSMEASQECAASSDHTNRLDHLLSQLTCCSTYDDDDISSPGSLSPSKLYFGMLSQRLED
uniref:Uncharacterized protein n=1 Tax=Steinernema glaseri TaxID=37863 RepID=A0A1I7ZQL4_9BILA